MTTPRDIIAAALLATHDADWRAKGLGRGPDITNERVAAAYLRDANAVLAALEIAGLPLPDCTQTIGWEVLTRQPDGTWLADWDALTHPSREEAEQQAIEAAGGAEHRPAWPARVARLVADGPIHEAEPWQPAPDPDTTPTQEDR